MPEEDLKFETFEEFFNAPIVKPSPEDETIQLGYSYTMGPDDSPYLADLIERKIADYEQDTGAKLTKKQRQTMTTMLQTMFGLGGGFIKRDSKSRLSASTASRVSQATQKQQLLFHEYRRLRGPEAKALRQHMIDEHGIEYAIGTIRKYIQKFHNADG